MNDAFDNVAGSLTNPFQYTAREFDPETSLYYYRARYYDPTSGRFLSEGPLGFRGSEARWSWRRYLEPISGAVEQYPSVAREVAIAAIEEARLSLVSQLQ